MDAERRVQTVQDEWGGGGTEEPPGLTRGAADEDPQSQAAVAVVMGGRGYGERHRKQRKRQPPASCRAAPSNISGCLSSAELPGSIGGEPHITESCG